MPKFTSKYHAKKKKLVLIMAVKHAVESYG
jgi:hypothetical protein